MSAGVSCGDCEFCRDGDPTLCVNFHLLGEHVTGVHSEYAAVPADNLIAVPDGVDWTTAGASTLVFQTAWRMLIDRADLEAGESVLVLGASGGVGHAAVQIADYAGAEVYATGSTVEKLEYARDHGADHVVNYEEQNFADWIREETGKRGVDVVVDYIGAGPGETRSRASRRTVDSSPAVGRPAAIRRPTFHGSSGTSCGLSVRRWEHQDRSTT